LRRGARRVGLLVLLASAGATAAPRYAWSPKAGADTLERRFPPPPGFTRVRPLEFGEWLRTLPLLPAGAPVMHFDGAEKPRQDVHAAVVDIDVGRRDLQQCADAVMRMRAEFLFSLGRPIAFLAEPGKPRVLAYEASVPDPGRRRFDKYLVRVFAEAGSASLQAQLQPVRGPAEPGDVLIQGGYPGHAVLVLDVVEDDRGARRLLLAQSYMPAQSFHVLLVEAGRPERGVWYDEAALDAPGGLRTPEWRPFTRKDLRRFAEPRR
jgi:hypothetical protein